MKSESYGGAADISSAMDLDNKMADIEATVRSGKKDQAKDQKKIMM